MAVRLVLSTMLLVGHAAMISAQSPYGGLRGAVRDANGVVPGVSLTLTNEATAVAINTTTNDVGEYVFANTPAATYTLTASMTGFRTFERRSAHSKSSSSM